MSRICQAFSYGDGPIKERFWGGTVSVLPRAPLRQDAQTEVAIIGAGVTGLNAALRLAQAGVSVTVLDAKQVGWGASGRNGGFCCLGGTKASYASLIKRYGTEDALDYIRTERAAVDHVEGLIDHYGWQVDRHSDGETILAHTPAIAQTLEANAASYADIYGVKAQVTAQEDLLAQGLGGMFYGALTHPIGFALNPLKYVSNLAQSCENAGVQIYGDTPVLQTNPHSGHWHLKTAQGTLTAHKLIIATNGYSSEHIPAWMAGRYMPAQSSVMVTRPITEAEQLQQGWTSAQMAYDSRNLLHYFRLMPDGRFLFGMRGGLSTGVKTHEVMRRQIRRDFERLFPAWQAVATTHYWSGYVCLTRDLTPFAAAVDGAENLYAAFAYHGNGVALGSYAGAMIADQILGQDKLRQPAIMRRVPRPFPLGRARRLLLYPAYLYYALKDR